MVLMVISDVVVACLYDHFAKQLLCLYLWVNIYEYTTARSHNVLMAVIATMSIMVTSDILTVLILLVVNNYKL